MFVSRWEKWTHQKPILCPHQSWYLYPQRMNESFQPNVLRTNLQCCIWKHGEEANPPDIDPTMHGWKRDAINKTMTPTLLRIASCNWLSVVVKVPPGVPALAPCCHVQSDVGVQVDWTVRMSTQNSSGTHTLWWRRPLVNIYLDSIHWDSTTRACLLLLLLLLSCIIVSDR